MSNLELTWGFVEEISVQIRNAVKRVNATDLPQAFRLLDWGVAMNCSDKYGRGFDLEVASIEGWASVGIFDPDTETVVDFDPPRVGEWIKVLGARVSNERDEFGKRKIRIQGGWQLRRIGRVAGKTGKVEVAPVAGRRRSRSSV